MKLPFKGCTLASYPTGSITQHFGENANLYKPFGLAYHNGIDLVGAHGTPLSPVENGLVVAVKNEPDGYGKHVRIQSNGREWTYGHLATITVKVGQQVTTNTIIGTMGNTGFVVSGPTPFWEHNPYAGTHLHLGLRLYAEDKNGFAYKAGPKVRILNYDNGVKGAVDPLPWLTQVPDIEEQKKRLNELTLTVLSLMNALVAKLRYQLHEQA